MIKVIEKKKKIFLMIMKTHKVKRKRKIDRKALSFDFVAGLNAKNDNFPSLVKVV